MTLVSTLTLLQALNPDDLITELSRACGVSSWAFEVRTLLSKLPSDASDDALFKLLSDAWWALPQEERAEALTLTPPLALMPHGWRAILTPDSDATDEALIDELVSLSAQYQARHGVQLSLESFLGVSPTEARAQLHERLTRAPLEERASLYHAHLQRAWRALQTLSAREALEGGH